MQIMMNLCKECGKKVGRRYDLCYTCKQKKKKRARRGAVKGNQFAEPKVNVPESTFEEIAGSLGLKAYKSGWPDYLVFNPVNKNIILIEVKPSRQGSSSRLRTNQSTMFKFLKQAGVRCEVVRVHVSSPLRGNKVKNQLKTLFKLERQKRDGTYLANKYATDRVLGQKEGQDTSSTNTSYPRMQC